MGLYHPLHYFYKINLEAIVRRSSVIWQKGESQNGGDKNTKHAILRTPPYSVRIQKNMDQSKIWTREKYGPE